MTESFNQLYYKISTWIPPKNNGNNVSPLLLSLYSYLLGVNFDPIVQDYKKRVGVLKKNFTKGPLISGAVCFYGSMLMSLLQLGYINNIEHLFTFASCYMLMDYHLDDPSIPDETKKQTLRNINSFMCQMQGSDMDQQTKNSLDNQTKNSSDNQTKNSPDNQKDPIIEVIGKQYLKMVRNIPCSEVHLKNIFTIESKTQATQKYSNKKREEYLKICEDKGGYTCYALQSLLELPITGEEYTLGACIQLVDDLLDIDEDMDSNIHSIVTHDYSTDGNLDKLLEYTVNRISDMDRKYNLFKPILLLGLVFAVHIHREKFTPGMLDLIDNFIYYQPVTTKESLLEWLEHKFKQQIDLICK